VVAFPAALGFAWLWLIERQHGGLLVAGVSLRVYAQFLRWWHQVGYSAASMNAATVPRPRTHRDEGSLWDEGPGYDLSR
jgi:hypothetical protein